jgi:hypothetical protein
MKKQKAKEKFGGKRKRLLLVRCPINKVRMFLSLRLILGLKSMQFCIGSIDFHISKKLKSAKRKMMLFF